MKILGFCGKAGSGKDTAAGYIKQVYGFGTYAMAYPLKAMLQVGLGLDPDAYQTPEQKNAVIPWLGRSYRDVAQTIGTEWGRDLVRSDLWLVIAQRNLEALDAMGAPGMCITDVRFENEAEMLRDLGGTLIHVYRQAPSALSATQQAHISERSVEVGPTDRVLFNYDGIDSLYAGVDLIYQSLWGAQ